MFKRAKTGPLAFNVEYTLSQLKLKKRALTDEERELANTAMPIDEKYPRPTTEEIRKLIERMQKGKDEESADTDGVDTEAVNEL